jgi:hypothetical protein
MAGATFTIGGLEFDSARGTHQDGQTETQTLRRWGVSGVDFRLGGSVPEPFDISTMITVHDAAQLMERKKQEKALVGTVQEMIDEQGNVLRNVAILGVKHEREQAVVTVVGGVNNFKGGSGIMLQSTWMLHAARAQ